MFGLFIWLFDNYLWKTNLFQRLEFLYIPNLNGVWETEIKTSFENFSDSIKAKTIIRQTATWISISFETEESTSYSIHAALVRVDRAKKYELIYVYENKPKADSVKSMNIHNGTAWLQILDHNDVLEGEYYTGRGRQNFGKVTITRTK